MQQVSESILQKVQKLQALAERAGTPAEAANAMARIQEILLKYNLDMQTVRDYKAVVKDDIIYERYNLNTYQTRHDGDFAYNLICALARFNFCKVIGHRQTQRPEYKFNEGKFCDQGDFTIIGQKMNVEMVMYMYDYCLNNLKILAGEAWKVYDKSETKIKIVFTRYFFSGAVIALRERLAEQKAESEKIHGEQMYAVVKYNDAAVAEKVAQLFPTLGHSKLKSFGGDTNIKSQGYAAGKRMDLNKALSDQSGTQNKQLC